VLTLWIRRSIGSNLKHFWLAYACAYKNAPATMRAELDGLPIWAHDGTIPPTLGRFWGIRRLALAFRFLRKAGADPCHGATPAMFASPHPPQGRARPQPPAHHLHDSPHRSRPGTL
jgi:hypothetical protein